MKVCVVGLGLIGGSCALDLRESGFATHVVGSDTHAEHARQALELGLVDSIAPLEVAVRDVALVIVATPVGAIAAAVARALDCAPASSAVTDLGSTKGEICRQLAPHAARARFVAAHPMAGTEHSGPKAAMRGLFAGKAAVVCDRETSGPAHLRRVEEMYAALKMRLVYMSSEEHDLHVAYVSHLSHVSSFVLANAVLAKEKDVKTIFDLASGGFESTVRLAKSSPDMWTPIFEQNRERVVESIETYILHLREFQRSLVDRDPGRTRALVENANRIRRVLTTLENKP